MRLEALSHFLFLCHFCWFRFIRVFPSAISASALSHGFVPQPSGFSLPPPPPFALLFVSLPCCSLLHYEFFIISCVFIGRFFYFFFSSFRGSPLLLLLLLLALCVFCELPFLCVCVFQTLVNSLGPHHCKCFYSSAGTILSLTDLNSLKEKKRTSLSTHTRPVKVVKVLVHI